MPLSLKATVTRRQADPVPSDMQERLEQLRHHQAVEKTATAMPAPAQAQDPDKAHQTAVEASTVIESEMSGKALKREANALQAAFLTGNLGKPVSVFLINGIKVTGKLRQFDQFTLLLEGQDGIRSMVFKHAVTTIAPAG